MGAEREASLQQEKAQGDLDWARKLEEAEREAYSRHEAVITQLSKSRDKVGGSDPPFEPLCTHVVVKGCGASRCDEIRVCELVLLGVMVWVDGVGMMVWV